MKSKNEEFLTLNDLEEILKKGRTLINQYKKIDKLTPSSMSPSFQRVDVANFFIQLLIKTNPNGKEH